MIVRHHLLAVVLAVSTLAACSHVQAPAAQTIAQAPAKAPKFSVDKTSLETFDASPAARAVVVKHLPTIFEHPAYAMIKTLSLKALQPYSQGALTEEKLKALQADLDLLP